MRPAPGERLTLVTTPRGHVLHYARNTVDGPTCGQRARYLWRVPTPVKTARRRLCRYCAALVPPRVIPELLDPQDVALAAYAAVDLPEFVRVVTAAVAGNPAAKVTRLSGTTCPLHELIAERKTALRLDDVDAKAARAAAPSTVTDDEAPLHYLGRSA